MKDNATKHPMGRIDYKNKALKQLRNAAATISKMTSELGRNDGDSAVQRLIEQLANRWEYGSAYVIMECATEVEKHKD